MSARLAAALAPLFLIADPPPAPRTEDRVLVAIFCAFALYKAVRLVKTTRLGWSFAIYNVVLASLFLVAIFVVPVAAWSSRIESDLVTVLRMALVASIIWCVVEVEISRHDLRDFPLHPRRGRGQQT